MPHNLNTRLDRIAESMAPEQKPIIVWRNMGETTEQALARRGISKPVSGKVIVVG